MGISTGIQWTDHTANFWWGCRKVGPGCANCYAEKLASRFGRDCWGDNPRRLIAGTNRNVRLWNRKAEKSCRRGLVFVNSMSDFFEDDDGRRVVASDGSETAYTLSSLRDGAWSLFAECRSLTFQLLTKRPGNLRRFIPREPKLISNVWLGATVACSNDAHDAIAGLAAVRDRVPVVFLSCEPLLEPLQLTPEAAAVVDWVIIGGESGSAARPCDIAWVKSLVAWCRQVGVAVFVKQLGSACTEWGEPAFFGRGKAAEIDHWPSAVRVREFPKERVL